MAPSPATFRSMNCLEAGQPCRTRPRGVVRPAS
jgi:hypothetical protein